MSPIAKGALVFRHMPAPGEAGITVIGIAGALGLGRRVVERTLAILERAGLATRKPGVRGVKLARWWRA